MLNSSRMAASRSASRRSARAEAARPSAALDSSARATRNATVCPRVAGSTSPPASSTPARLPAPAAKVQGARSSTAEARARPWWSFASATASFTSRVLAATCSARRDEAHAQPPPASTIVVTSEHASATASRRLARSDSARARASAPAIRAAWSRSWTPARYAGQPAATTPGVARAVLRARPPGSRAPGRPVRRRPRSRRAGRGRRPCRRSAGLPRISPEVRPANAGSPVRISQRIEPSAEDVGPLVDDVDLAARLLGGHVRRACPCTLPACDRSPSEPRSRGPWRSPSRRARAPAGRGVVGRSALGAGPWRGPSPSPAPRRTRRP